MDNRGSKRSKWKNNIISYMVIHIILFTRTNCMLYQTFSLRTKASQNNCSINSRKYKWWTEISLNFSYQHIYSSSHRWSPSSSSSRGKKFMSVQNIIEDFKKTQYNASFSSSKREKWVFQFLIFYWILSKEVNPLTIYI